MLIKYNSKYKRKYTYSWRLWWRWSWWCILPSYNKALVWIMLLKPQTASIISLGTTLASNTACIQHRILLINFCFQRKSYCARKHHRVCKWLFNAWIGSRSLGLRENNPPPQMNVVNIKINTTAHGCIITDTYLMFPQNAAYKKTVLLCPEWGPFQTNPTRLLLNSE